MERSWLSPHHSAPFFAKGWFYDKKRTRRSPLLAPAAPSPLPTDVLLRLPTECEQSFAAAAMGDLNLELESALPPPGAQSEAGIRRQRRTGGRRVVLGLFGLLGLVLLLRGTSVGRVSFLQVLPTTSRSERLSFPAGDVSPPLDHLPPGTRCALLSAGSDRLVPLP